MIDTRKSGFTLLEMMISFVILTIAITGIYKAISSGLFQSGQRMAQYEATEVAISLISEFEVLRPAMPTDGEIGNKWRWTAQTDAYLPTTAFPPGIRFNQLTVEVFRSNETVSSVVMSRILSAEVVE